MGQIGSVYKQPETEVDDSYHSWRVPSKWKWVQRGAGKGEQRGSAREQGEQGESAMYRLYHNPCLYVCMMNDCNRERYLLLIMTIARMNVAMYIIITGMNVVANLNFV